MTSEELRAALADLFGEGSDRELAIKAAPVLRVHFRSIIKWLDGDRAIPGTVVALLECLQREKRAAPAPERP